MIENEVEFTIRNLNREKIFKEIVKIAEVKDVKFVDTNIKFSVNKKYSKKIQKLLDKKSARLENKSEKGLWNYLKNTILRVGIIIPIILFFIFILISNNFVFRYEILGTNLIENQQVLDLLKQKNVSGICAKKSINTKTLEQEILEIDKVSLVSVIIKGNTLIVNIKEKVYNSEYEEKDNFKPLLSKFNGTITALNVIQGTPLVKIGQTVKVGQELIAPFTKDTSGNVLSIKPMAEIKADIYYTTTTQETENKIEYKDTGKSYTTKKLLLFNNTIFFNGSNQNFKFYRTENKNDIIGEKNGLPIEYILTTYYEQEQVVTKNYFSLNKQTILQQCKQKTRQQLGNYDIIKDEYHTISHTAGIYQITYTIVAEGSLI